MKSSARY